MLSGYMVQRQGRFSGFVSIRIVLCVECAGGCDEDLAGTSASEAAPGEEVIAY
jgi:hypothetical protein